MNPLRSLIDWHRRWFCATVDRERHRIDAEAIAFGGRVTWNVPKSWEDRQHEASAVESQWRNKYAAASAPFSGVGTGGPQPWYIHLSAHATVAELAALMQGLGCEVRAEHTGAGEFCIKPLDPAAPRPSTLTIHDLLTRSSSNRLPSLLIEGSSRAKTTGA